jgi:glycosyltransferase involved in cell wall biosynthesis
MTTQPRTKMRIGLIAPPWIPVPPPHYGGTEAVVDNLARGLLDAGHDVRLFTVGESTCPVPRLHRYPTAVSPMENSALELAHALSGYEALRDVDVIHDHTLAGPVLTHPRQARPALVVTHHGPFSADMRTIFTAAARQAAVVAISHAQAKSGQPVPISAVIHHGIDTDLYRPGPGGGGFALFMGRMSPDKGVDRAVRVAHRAGVRLVIVTRIREQLEQEYFDQTVTPLLGPEDDLLVEPDAAVRLDLLGRAEALLDPIDWPEPFGLVMAEALSCGTPVLAFPRGAAPEIVEHGRTGFLCEGEDEMVSALGRVSRLDRADCRAAAEQRFSVRRMVADHEQLYHRLLVSGGGRESGYSSGASR